MSVTRGETDQRAVAAPRPVRSSHFALGPGRMQAVPRSTPVQGVGRHTARCYCPTCGRKRAVCRCEEAA